MPSFPTFLRTAHFPVVAALAACIVLSGCATRTRAPVEDRSAVRGGPVPRMQAPAPIVSGPVNEALPPTYTVKRGDTLHQIALDTGLDYRELAAWNNIENVNRIYVGQVLRLTPPGAPGASAFAATPGGPEPSGMASDAASGVVTAPLRATPPIGEAATNAVTPPPSPPIPSAPPPPSAKVISSPKAIKEPYSEQAVRDLNLAASAIPAPSAASSAAPMSPPTKSDATPPAGPATRNTPPAAATSNAPPPAATNASPGTTTANSPASAADAKSASASSPAAQSGDHLDWIWPAKGRIVTSFSETANLKGIDIAGTAGEPVRASAPGRVVYAGNGLRGYGKLIIIKHNDTYLSAYAHNREILVKEGQQVTRGQKIAEMGNTDADQVKLHFEIRRHGKPMDPTKYLPPT
jgi:lipoprotein NlpD